MPLTRSLGSELNLHEAFEALTGSKAVEDLLDIPLEDFVKRVLPEEKQARATYTVGDLVSRTGEALAPVLSVLDYDNAFVAVQVSERSNNCVSLIPKAR